MRRPAHPVLRLGLALLALSATGTTAQAAQSSSAPTQSQTQTPTQTQSQTQTPTPPPPAKPCSAKDTAAGTCPPPPPAAPSRSTSQQFPFPGDAPDSDDPLPSSPHTPSAPDPANPAPATPPAGKPGSSFPYPGDPDANSSGSSSSSSSGSSSSSSSSSSDDPDVPPADTPADKPTRRKLPKVTQLQSNDEREAEDIKVARFYHDDGNFLGAYNRLKDAVSLIHDDADAWFLLGEVAGRLDKTTESAEAYNKFLALEPDTRRARQAHRALSTLDTRKPAQP